MAREFKWHPVLIRAVLTCLREIFVEGYYADKVIEHNFKKHREWGSRDRRFIAETVYDMVRWWLFLAALDEGQFAPTNENDFFLRFCFYQAWKNDRDATRVLTDRADFSFETIKERIRRARLKPWEEVSFPEWLYRRIQGNPNLKNLNEQAPVFLRVNELKATVESTVHSLAAEGIQTERAGDLCLRLQERKNVFTTQAFKEGMFEVQDIGSQKIAKLLNPKPGERIADVCAGAGGKTLHLAALMKNKGTLLAGDISEKKLEQLKIRARRAGVSNLRIQKFATTKDLKKHSENFDGVLIDAPCSGTGVLRRNPDTKWKLSEQDLQELKQTQSKILDDFCRLVRPGGRLVYATCSILREENEDQVENFLSSHPDFEKAESFVTQPGQNHADGFFAQTLVKAPKGEGLLLKPRSRQLNN